MCLAMLPLERMLLLTELLVVVRGLPRVCVVFVDELLLFLDRGLVHIVEVVHTKLDVTYERVAPVPREVFANHNSQHLETVCLGCHCVGGYDPAPYSQF